MGSSHSLTFKSLSYEWSSLQGVLRTPTSPPSTPTRRPYPSYRIFIPQSPRWEASRRQSLPVMLFGSNNICSCSKSSGGSLRWRKGVVEGEDGETQPGSADSSTPCSLCTPRDSNPKHPPPPTAAQATPTSPIAGGWLGDRGWGCPGFLLRCLEPEDFHVLGLQALSQQGDREHT